MKEIIIHENISCCYLKLLLLFTKECDLLTLCYKRFIQTISCFLGWTGAKVFSLPDVLEWVNVRDKWNFRAGCIEQVQCGYIYIRVPSKKKTWGMPGTDIYFILSIKQRLDGIGWGAPLIIEKCIIYQSLLKNIVTGRVNSQAFQVSSSLIGRRWICCY